MDDARAQDHPRLDLDALAPLRVCINLDRRPDRWRRMRRRLARLGLGAVDRFPAVDGRCTPPPESGTLRPGAYGCLQSHLEVVRRARRAAAPGVLILEDDAELADDWPARLAAALDALPDDWDLLYFGCNHLEPPAPLAAGVARVVQAHSTFAYILRGRAYDAFLEANRDAQKPVDINLLRFQQERTCYALWPNAAWVEPSHSDILEMHQDYWFLRESLMVTPGTLDDLAGRMLAVVPLASAGWRRATPEHLSSVVERLHAALPGLDVALGIDRPSDPRWRGFADALADDGPPGDVPILPDFRAAAPMPGAPTRALAGALGGRHRVVLCAGSPVHLLGQHLSAAVQMCRRYDLVLPFRRCRPLSMAQTRASLEGRVHWHDPALCPGRAYSARQLGWWVLNLESAGRVPAEARRFATFEAPSLALRLATDGPAAGAAE